MRLIIMAWLDGQAFMLLLFFTDRWCGWPMSWHTSPTRNRTVSPTYRPGIDAATV